MSNNRVFEEALSSFLSAGLAVAGLSLAAFFVYKLSGRSLFEFLTKKPDSFEHDIKKKLMQQGDDDEQNQNAQQRLRAQRQRILAQLRDMRLNSYEQTVFDTCLVTNEEIEVSFADVGALEDIKKQLYNAVIFPLQHPEIFDNPKSLRKPVKGVLLYGMPGTGKTMLARAVAKECGCLFINVQRQIIDHHYYGESERLTAAVFSLAKKLQPVVIFIDEIDALLMNRQSIDGSSSGSEVRKNQVSVMLSLWDGLSSSEKDRIIVIGATNLLSDLDPAALRRMPLQLHVPLPGAQARKDILQVILRHEPLDPKFNIDDVVRETDGFSGSDLKELCKQAVMIPVHEAFEARLNSMKQRHPALRATNSQAELNDELHGEVKIAVRTVSNKDFSEALRLVCPESRKVQQRRNAREAQAAELDPSAILQDLVANMNWAKK